MIISPLVATELLLKFVRAALDRRAILRRSFLVDLRDNVSMSTIGEPVGSAVEVALAGASVIMIAELQGVTPAPWALEVKRPHPNKIVFLDDRASLDAIIRLAQNTPEPLKRLGFAASPKYYQMV